MSWFFSSGPNYDKLKTNLRLAINRMKLLEKKRTEMSLKTRKDIYDYLSSEKIERAKLLVEQIIREDYFVEVLEIVEMYCDLLVARFGLLQTQEAIDPGLEESIATILWVAPRIRAEVPEISVVADQLENKFSKQFADACRANSLDNVSERVMRKLSPEKYPNELIDSYLKEIKQSYQSQLGSSPVKPSSRLSGDKAPVRHNVAGQQPSSNQGSDLPNLPSVPGDNSLESHDSSTDNMDFDDLTRRFEELKRRK